jgi:hypothetical protein
MTGRREFGEAAEKTLRLFAPRLNEVPQATPHLLIALDFLLHEPWRAVVAGDPASPGTQALLRAVHSVYQPGRVVLGNNGAVDPFARTLAAGEGARVYLCTGTACQPPTGDAETVRKILR